MEPHGASRPVMMATVFKVRGVSLLYQSDKILETTCFTAVGAV